MNALYKAAKTVLFRFTPEQAHHIILSNLDWITQFGLQKLVTRRFPEDPIEVMGLRWACRRHGQRRRARYRFWRPGIRLGGNRYRHA